MAKHFVHDFSIELLQRPDNPKYSDIHLSITTEISKNFNYEIHADKRHPSLEQLNEILFTKLNLAKEKKSKIDIHDYPERFYLFIDDLQMSAHKK